MSHNYDYLPCMNCGQVVAHTKRGEPLHMHRDSAKCERIGKILRKANVTVENDGSLTFPMNSPAGDAFLESKLREGMKKRRRHEVRRQQ